jgi:hypothetical protein
MVTRLSDLVERTQGAAIPMWLHHAVVEQRETIEKELREKGQFTLKGPNGEQVVIRAEKQTAAAA